MGRYYFGDIEGKFCFGVQSSDDANFFGFAGIINNDRECELVYNFEREDLEKIRKGIKKCRCELGDYKEAFDTFFKKNNGYNNDMLVKEVCGNPKRCLELFEWYARLELGLKILKCVEDNGICSFKAEC